MIIDVLPKYLKILTNRGGIDQKTCEVMPLGVIRMLDYYTYSLPSG